MKKAFLLCGIFLVFSLFGSAFSQETKPPVIFGEADLAAGKVIAISPIALKAGSASYYQDWTFYTYPDEAYIASTGTSPYTPILRAPVYLPNGAVVKKLTVYFTDNDDQVDYHLTVYLWRQRYTSSAYDTMAWITSDGLSASPDRRILKDDTVVYAQVQNHVYSYYLEVVFEEPGLNVKFHGAKIVYE